MKEIMVMLVMAYMAIAFALTIVGVYAGAMMLIAAPVILIVGYLAHMLCYLYKEVKGL